MEYKIFVALHADISSGWIWASSPDFNVPHRSVVRVKNLSKKKTIYCELFQIDSNFQNIYNLETRVPIDHNQPSIVINEWYRKKLEITYGKSTLVDLEISKVGFLYRLVAGARDHPQMIARVGIWLGIISVALGMIGVFLGFLAFNS